jgi:hypothetical protein
MFGEANVIKHLFRLGINVTYKQKLIDEYDFGVTNLASDIRDKAMTLVPFQIK